MKQRITIQQIQELTYEQQAKLREWWKPRVFDVFSLYMKFEKVVEALDKEGNILTDESNEDGYFENEKIDTLPLLSIGQCIEILSEKGINDGLSGWINAWSIDIDWDGELIDTLWESVKSTL